MAHCLNIVWEKKQEQRGKARTLKQEATYEEDRGKGHNTSTLTVYDPQAEWMQSLDAVSLTGEEIINQ